MLRRRRETAQLGAREVTSGLRLQKRLEDANVKLTRVVTDISGRQRPGGPRSAPDRHAVANVHSPVGSRQEYRDRECEDDHR